MLKATFVGLMLVSISVCTLGEPLHLREKRQNQHPDDSCICVDYFLCLANGTFNVHGADIIDERFDRDKIPKPTPKCKNEIQVCCYHSDIKNSKDLKPPKTEPYISRGCGYRNLAGFDLKISGDINNNALQNEFPWMVALFKTKLTADGHKAVEYKCGGSLIHKRVVLTAAHCVKSLNPSELVVRAGEWDISTTVENLPHQERNVNAIIKHPDFEPSWLGHDFALIILTSAFELADNVDVACLPKSNEEINSKNCFVSGWGKSKFEDKAARSPILKIVQVPTVPAKECEERLRRSRLGYIFSLHHSFMCAGGVPGSDACTGDGGSPLVCPLKGYTDRYVQAGIVAYGIGCNNQYPGVYAKIAAVRPWIDETLQKYNIYLNSFIV